MAARGDRRAYEQYIERILAIGPDYVLNYRTSALPHLAKHLGLFSLRHYMTNETELIRQICLRHLNDAFDAVCLPSDWCGAPEEVLRAMCLSLLDYIGNKPSRHLVFLLHRQGLPEHARHANDLLLSYLTHNFQLAFQAITPEKSLDALKGVAQMLLGQIMHLPLWWPEEPLISKDAWLCHQIGHLTGTAPPNRRLPPVGRMEGENLATVDWGNRHPADPPSHDFAY